MKIALWILGALAGVVLAAGVTYAASSLSTQRIGLSSEPVNAGRELAPARRPPRAPRPPRRPRSRSRRRSGGARPTATPPPTATAVPTAVPTVDDHGGGGGDDSGGGGRGRDHPEDD